VTRRLTAVRAAALVGLILPLAVGTSESTGAAPAVAVAPPGTITIVEDAAWSWFEDERAQLSADGALLYASAVAGEGSTKAAPGTVLVAEVRLQTGARRLADLGRGEADDHNSASIWEAPTGEVTTSWARHTQDPLIRTQRRRTDGSWLRLPPVTVSQRTTYSTLVSSTGAAGEDLLYDFYRGERFDPSVLVSADVGRTWNDLGPILRDPADTLAGRPYVQYVRNGPGRVDLVATETHPRDSPTSVYHGFIEGGRIYNSSGTLLGPLGATIPVSALTRVWTPTGDARAWLSSLEIDPSTGLPALTFSVRVTAADHRYWHAAWDGSAWTAAEVAFAGRALYATEADYTGLATLDPADADHMVISTDAHPVTGAPLVSATDGRRHWELWDGRRVAGTWTWTALTTGSAVDNLRPVLTASGGAQAMLWMRGTYTTYARYDLDVVGVVRRAGGALVPASPAPMAPVIDVLPLAPPRDAAATPIVGQMDGHRADDFLLARPGSAPEDLLLGDEQRHPTPVSAPTVIGTYTPVPGDYDGNGTTDIYWYAPGTATDSLWLGTGVGRFTKAPVRQVIGTYTPVPGDYDGNGTTDIYWYGPGTATDSLWTADRATFTPRSTRQVRGVYTPLGGDHDADGFDDIFWYAPGSTSESRWRGGPGAAFVVAATRQVIGTYTPVGGDYDGNGRTDVLWYAPGSSTDRLWLAQGTGAFVDAAVRPIVRTYRPISGDFDGDGRDDVHLYAPGVSTDRLWWSTAGPLADDEAAAANL
jgi:hypothetical protein